MQCQKTPLFLPGLFYKIFSGSFYSAFYSDVSLSLSCMLSISQINTISMHFLSGILNLLTQLLPNLLMINFLSVVFFHDFQL